MNKTPWKRRIKGMMFKMPLMISCEEFEEFIIEYLEDGLTSRQRSLFEFHLKICRECREYLAAYRTSMEAAKMGLDDESDIPDEIPEDLIAAVLASRSPDKPT